METDELSLSLTMKASLINDDGLTGSWDVDQACSVNRVSKEGVRIEKEEKQLDKIITWLQPVVRLEQLYTLPVCFYIILGTSKEHGQFFD